MGSLTIDEKIRDAREFLLHGIWRKDVRSLPFIQRFLIRSLRILVVLVRDLGEERIHLRAASLTFYTLLSIVPVLAMLFGLAKGFGLDRLLEQELLSRGQGQEEIITRMIGFAHNLLETTKGGVVAGVGLLVLFWSVVKVFGSIEKSFNEIWGGARERPLLRKATDYLSLSVLCAVLLSLSSALTVLITSEVTFFVNRVKILETFSPAIFLGLKLLPLMVSWVLFTLLYAVIPNVHVDFASAVLGGVLAGTAFQLFQEIYIQFQIGVAKVNAVYGSFAALPLFLAWLQASWLIVLLGARISFAYQNQDRLTSRSESAQLGTGPRRILALIVTHRVVKHFRHAEGALGEEALARELHVPMALLGETLEELLACGVLSQVKSDGDREAMYLPGLDPQRISIQLVMDRLDQNGSQDFPLPPSDTMERITESLEQFRRVVQSSPANLLLKDI